MDAYRGERGEHLFGQYFHAFPGHAAELDKPLDEELRQRWMKLIKKAGIEHGMLPSASTRGEFIGLASERARLKH